MKKFKINPTNTCIIDNKSKNKKRIQMILSDLNGKKKSRVQKKLSKNFKKIKKNCNNCKRILNFSLGKIEEQRKMRIEITCFWEMERTGLWWMTCCQEMIWKKEWEFIMMYYSTADSTNLISQQQQRKNNNQNKKKPLFFKKP